MLEITKKKQILEITETIKKKQTLEITIKNLAETNNLVKRRKRFKCFLLFLP